MTPSEIISADAQQHGIDPKKVLNYVATQVQQKKATLMAANNSILLLVDIGDLCAELHLYTQDSPAELMKSIPHFIDVIRKTPLKRVYGDADNDGIIRLLSRLGVDVEDSDRPQFNWMANV